MLLDIMLARPMVEAQHVWLKGPQHVQVTPCDSNKNFICVSKMAS